RLGEVPGDHHTVRQFLHIMRPRRSRLKKHANRGSAFDQSGCRLLQGLESPNRDAAITWRVRTRSGPPVRFAKSDGSRSAYMQRSPAPDGEGKLKLMQGDVRSGHFRSKNRIPLQIAILDVINRTLRDEPQGAADKIEQIGFP